MMVSRLSMSCLVRQLLRDSSNDEWRALVYQRLCVLGAPVVSFGCTMNLASTAGWSVTVSGLSFGALDATPTLSVGLSHCRTLSWTSATSVACDESPGDGSAKSGLLTVAGITGSRTASFTFDCTVDCHPWFHQYVSFLRSALKLLPDFMRLVSASTSC